MPFHDDDDSRDAYRDFRDEQDSRDIDEGPGSRDLTPDDFTTVRCTFCKKLIFEHADQCPYCQHWQLNEERLRKPRWFVITVILCVAALLLGGAMAWILWGVL